MFYKHISDSFLKQKLWFSKLLFNQGQKTEDFIGKIKDSPREGDEELLTASNDYAIDEYKTLRRYPNPTAIHLLFSPRKYSRAKKEIKELKQRAQERLRSLEQIAA